MFQACLVLLVIVEVLSTSLVVVARCLIVGLFVGISCSVSCKFCIIFHYSDYADMLVYSLCDLCSLNRGEDVHKPVRSVRKHLFSLGLWAPPRDRVRITTAAEACIAAVPVLY